MTVRRMTITIVLGVLALAAIIFGATNPEVLEFIRGTGEVLQEVE